MNKGRAHLVALSTLAYRPVAVGLTVCVGSTRTLEIFFNMFSSFKSFLPESMGRRYSEQTDRPCSHQDTCRWHGFLEE